jgi:hypothetical protein
MLRLSSILSIDSSNDLIITPYIAFDKKQTKFLCLECIVYTYPTCMRSTMVELRPSRSGHRSEEASDEESLEMVLCTLGPWWEQIHVLRTDCERLSRLASTHP